MLFIDLSDRNLRFSVVVLRILKRCDNFNYMNLVQYVSITKVCNQDRILARYLNQEDRQRCIGHKQRNEHHSQLEGGLVFRVP